LENYQESLHDVQSTKRETEQSVFYKIVRGHSGFCLWMNHTEISSWLFEFILSYFLTIKANKMHYFSTLF